VTEPLEVLVTAPWARRLGGAEEMLWEFLRTYPRELISVATVFMERGPLQSQVAALGVPAAVIEAGRLSSPLDTVRTVGALARMIRRRRPAVVLNWMAKTQLYGASAAVLSGTAPRVVWWQHLIPNGHWMDRAATALPTAAVGASSEASADAQRRQRPSRPTFCVYPGIDIPREGVASVSREELGLSSTATVITLVGRLQPWKGQDRAIRALAALQVEGLDVELLIVGGSAFGFDIGYETELRELIDHLGLEDRIVMTGQVESAHPYLAVSDIALNASESEPFGIVMLEALANSVAVVAVDAGGPREVLTDGDTGALAPDGSPQALASALRPLIEGQTLRTTMARAGNQLYQRRFSAAAMSRRIAEELVAVTL
jgi:glycosyltransferase involved in cell wall biosynthesis